MTDIQLSEAACDNLRVDGFRPAELNDQGVLVESGPPVAARVINRESPHFHSLCEHDISGDPQDIGIETFSTDTLERGMPND